MTRTLRSERQGAARGQAKQMVVFVHGYGAGGADLMGLADPLAPHLPDAVFFAPDAPLPEDNTQPTGRSWFPIPWIDGSREEDAKRGLLDAVDDLNAFLDEKLTQEGLGAQSLALIGFSQGAMLSLHIAPRRAAPLACVVAISGRLLMPETLTAELRHKPPVLLMHGDMDEVVPFEDMARAGDVLTQAGFDTYAHTMRGMGHGISPDGLGCALGFLKQHMPISAA